MRTTLGAAPTRPGRRPGRPTAGPPHSWSGVRRLLADYARGPLRDTAWITFGAIIATPPTVLAVAALKSWPR